MDEKMWLNWHTHMVTSDSSLIRPLGALHHLIYELKYCHNVGMFIVYTLADMQDYNIQVMCGGSFAKHVSN
jgi:hypothetical protein